VGADDSISNVTSNLPSVNLSLAAIIEKGQWPTDAGVDQDKTPC
jgi:hypothetical protein